MQKRILMLFVAVVVMLTIIFLPGTTSCRTDLDPERKIYANYYGRLSIPSVGIDVLLYKSNEQYVVDRQDSAAIFKLSYRPKVWIIADHNTQAFASMTDIVVGDEAQIDLKDGDTVYLECAEVYDGHNTGHGLTDEHGVNCVGKYPYVSYTCIGYWRNIRICQWNIVEESTDER